MEIKGIFRYISTCNLNQYDMDDSGYPFESTDTCYYFSETESVAQAMTKVKKLINKLNLYKVNSWYQTRDNLTSKISKDVSYLNKVRSVKVKDRSTYMTHKADKVRKDLRNSRKGLAGINKKLSSEKRIKQVSGYYNLTCDGSTAERAVYNSFFNQYCQDSYKNINWNKLLLEYVVRKWTNFDDVKMAEVNDAD